MTAEQIIKVLEENYSFKITSKGKVIAEKDFPKIAKEILALMPSEEEIEVEHKRRIKEWLKGNDDAGFFTDGANFVKNFKRT